MNSRFTIFAGVAGRYPAGEIIARSPEHAGGFQRISDNRTDMINRVPVASRTLLAALVLTASITQSACRTDKPGPEPGAGSTDTMAAPASEVPYTDTVVTADTTALSPAGDGPGPGPGATGSTPGWNRTELVKGMQRFITAIDSGDREMFWNSLSERSLNRIEKGQLGSREEIWTAARQTFTDIENRRITVVGGSTDSVALRIDGRRLIDSVREDDPIIVHLLREQSDWKVMYPGLLYPKHHLRR